MFDIHLCGNPFWKKSKGDFFMLQMPVTGYPYSVNGGFAFPVNTVWEVIDNKTDRFLSYRYPGPERCSAV